VGALLAALGRHLPSASERASPLPWGNGERLRELFGPEVAIPAPRRTFLWRFPSVEHQVAFLSAFHGPTATALQALDPDRVGALIAELLKVAERFNVSDDTLVLQLTT
jgi:hypothetical protein